MAQRLPVLIAGAGIAGLAAAVALSRRGLTVRVLEKRQEFSTAGAGIQIGPNGARALAALGLKDAIVPVGFKPAGICIYDGATGRRHNTVPLGDAAQQRFQSPNTTLRRADLQALLRQAAMAASNVTVETGFELSGIDPAEDTIAVRSADGRTVTGAALVGADGVWSRLRSWQGGAPPSPSGYTAYRAIIERPLGADHLPAPFGDSNVGLWLGRSAHVVHYPVDGGASLNVVVIVQSAPGPEDWDRPGTIADVEPHLAGWSPQLVALLRRAPEWRRWSVFTVRHVAPWAKGRTLLIGDAAHPILPFLAQGAVMALEDAVVLGRALAETLDDPTAAFVRFETLRRRRVERVAAASKRNGAIYHVTGLAAAARDAALRLAPPARLLGQYDWLYGYDVSASL